MGWFSDIFSPVVDLWHSATVENIPNSVREIYTPTLESVNNAAQDATRDVYNWTTQTPGKITGAITGSNKVKNILQPPTWDELARPGEAFYNEFNEASGLLPPSWRQYAAPAVATALNFVPGVGPLLSAGFSTAYNAGGMQANQKGMDWGKVGKDAAINFGTAAAQMGANKLISNAIAASASKGANNLAASGNAPATSNFLTTAPVQEVANSATGVGVGGGNLVGGVPSTMSSFSTLNAGKSASAVPATQAAQPSNNLGDMAYKGAVQTTPQITNQALTATLAPELAQPISGTLDQFDAMGGEDINGYQFGDYLNAFGDSTSLNTPNPTGKRIGAAELDAMTKRIGANYNLQGMEARDQFLPTGQTEAPVNTPYSERLSNIETGTNQTYQDLLKEVDNYNAYYGIMDANPNITAEQMNTWLTDPTTRPQGPTDYFQGIQPMSMFNTSLIR